MGAQTRALCALETAPSFFSRAAGRLLGLGTGANKLPLGLLMGFLPCGMVYAALLKAVETGSAVDGALSMLAFGVGTSGALLAIGFFSSAITSRFGRYANALASASMILLGGYLVYRGMHAAAPQAQACHHEHSS